ncbi:MAG: hypothetical protein PHR30_00845 [Gallionellaceae bacterium]|nr:hypothetical protein [Gallionellaceae bacterium]
MTQVTFGYSDSEDRVWLSSSAGVRFWLTRRQLSGLLRPMCEILEKSVPGDDIPNALPASQRIALEHEEALADSPEGQPALEKNKETRSAGTAPVQPPILATGINFQADSRHCALIITAGHEPARIDLSRMDCHRLLAALHQTSVSAGWAVAGLPGWLSGPR